MVPIGLADHLLLHANRLLAHGLPHSTQSQCNFLFLLFSKSPELETQPRRQQAPLPEAAVHRAPRLGNAKLRSLPRTMLWTSAKLWLST
eukprot:1404372-Pleurochrysis_carterae.AAC.1